MSTAQTGENWFEVFQAISPYSWGYLGIALTLTLSIIGAAWYLSV